MLHLAARVHALAHGLFKPSDKRLTRDLYDQVVDLRRRHGLDTDDGRVAAVVRIARQVAAIQDGEVCDDELVALATVIDRILGFEGMFDLPAIDWDAHRSVSEYWSLRDNLRQQRDWLLAFDAVEAQIITTLATCTTAIRHALPDTRRRPGDVVVPTRKVHAIADLGEVVETIAAAFETLENEPHALFGRHAWRLRRNLVVAAGGNPDDSRGLTRAPKLPSKAEIRDPAQLVATYLGGTPIADLFAGDIEVAIPTAARFEHHHIVAGSGHGKTQTLQYLIAEDLQAVARGERSVVVLDSQGDLIRTIAGLKLFAPGQPLHDRVVIVDPTDVEYPVSLNLFDVGLERLDGYAPLDRERLTNSILELYDFVLGSLLAAEMTQKQSVIFRYVTRLMLHIPDATIHTLRELMEPKSEVKFAPHLAKLTGTARQFFETEFPSKEFEQTRRQVLRRLWGILENQTFERMFSHPRSKLDLYAEMNAGKVILINTAKDLLKETGTEIFGRFFIALIAQAAQERATLPASRRTPTFVYVDEAADYFDRNIGLILAQARKYNVGMVLAHQYLGQLEPKLQEAFGANTSIKFAGGVSNRDARTLAPMLGCEPAQIEAQPKGTFMASIRGVTRSALPLRFPFGRLENSAQMTADERKALRDAMRARHAVHYSQLATPAGAASDDGGEGAEQPAGTAPPTQVDPDDGDTGAKPTW